MRLAEALILRADTQKRIEQLKHRLVRNAKVQEGDRPAEEPQELLREMKQAAEQLTRLIQQINRTNAATELEPGLTLSDGLAVRDVLKMKHSIYQSLANEATVTQSRYTKSEIKFSGTVDVAAIQTEADNLAKAHRELDTKIQEANWRVELSE
jgi:hypothetical protein